MKPQYKVYREASIFYFSTPVFWCSLFFKNMSTPRLESTVLISPFCFKINLKVTSFYIFLNFLEFYLSPECLLNFPWLIYSPICGKSFQFMVFTFLENAFNPCIFTHVSFSYSKLQVEFFENVFPPRQKGWSKLWFSLSKFNQKICRWLGILVWKTWNIGIFCMICNFPKCDCFTVLWIISMK